MHKAYNLGSSRKSLSSGKKNMAVESQNESLTKNKFLIVSFLLK